MGLIFALNTLSSRELNIEFNLNIEPVYKRTPFPDVLPLAKNSDCFFRLSEMLPGFFLVVLAHSFPNQLYPLSQTVPMQFRRFLVSVTQR